MQGLNKRAPLDHVSILGFFWTVSPSVDFVLVTMSEFLCAGPANGIITNNIVISSGMHSQ